MPDENAMHGRLIPAVALSIAAGVALSAAAAEPPLVTSRDIADERYINKTVRFEGTVTGQFNDESNPQYRFATLEDDFGCVYLSSRIRNCPLLAERDYTGCRVSVIGRISRATRKDEGARRYIFHELHIRDGGNLTVLDTPRADPFDVPELSPDIDISPADLAGIGIRRLSGLVLAVRPPDEILLLNASNTVSHVKTLDSTLPRPGAFIKAAGRVETDTYFLRLAGARWRDTPPIPIEEPPPQEFSARQILSRDETQTTIRTDLHGKPVRIRAVVRSLPDPGFGRQLIFAESDGVTFTIDADSCPSVVGSLERGSTISATGICWIEIGNWRPTAPFPQARDFSLALRSPADVKVLANPPWWTPARLAAVIGAMALLIVAVLVWNRALRKEARRQGRLLFREQVARMSAELRAKERSRLAVELHDSISQILTGVALKIKAAQATARTDLDRSLANLSIAESSLRSSREELRHCLWDLRNNIFDIPDFEEAVRQMLRPCIGDAEIAVRLQMERKRISDSTAHEILKIIRELAVNAVRHGAATKIMIAGCLDGDVLSFSVKDNGIGYDETSAPGPEQGHFGILGIRDRLSRCNGALDIQGTPGAGTKATVSMHVDLEDEEERR